MMYAIISRTMLHKILFVVLPAIILSFSLSFETFAATLAITSQSTNKVINEGNTLRLYMKTNTQTGVSYKWFKSGSVISTSRYLKINNVTSANAGKYYCLATDGFTTARCTPFTVTVASAGTGTTTTPTTTSTLTLVSQPSNTSIYEGGTATFNMSATGNLGISYTWYKDGTAIGTGNSFSISNATTANAGTYSCKAADTVKSISCASFTLTVNTKVRISQQPVNQVLNEGGSASLSVTVTGTAPITYQWYGNGSAISGATSSTLAFSSAKVANSGSYYCVVKNPGSSANSNTATLSIIAAVKTGSAVISWKAPTSRTDGTKLSAGEIESYELYYSPENPTGMTLLTSVGASELSITVDDLTSGTHYFALATRDSTGLQSSLSSTISVVIP